MKVYCSRCKFYVPGYNIPYSFGPPNEQKEKCMCPENFYDMYVSEKVRPKSNPQTINRFNNCKWFEPKDWEPEPSSSSSGDCSSSSSYCGFDAGNDEDYTIYIEHVCDSNGCHFIHHRIPKKKSEIEF